LGIYWALSVKDKRRMLPFGRQKKAAKPLNHEPVLDKLVKDGTQSSRSGGMSAGELKENKKPLF
jgi:hypothetical protein